MPLQYAGVVAEHNAVRNSVGVFDVSHLGKLRVAGPGSGDALQNALTADVVALDVGRATYSLVLNDDGGCVDDVFVYRIEPGEWMVVPNAANVEAVAAAIERSGGSPTDQWDRWAILAIQGPDSFEAFERVFPGSGAPDLELHGWRRVELLDAVGIVARTGYTGERGFELYVPSEVAERVFALLLDDGVPPVGLGARDTLRLEMGYALYGHELTLEINPLEANLGWALAWHTPFRGRDALRAVKEAGPARRSFGIRCRGRGVPREGFEVVKGDRPVGFLTSGNFSPTLRCGIGLGLGSVNDVPSIGEAVSVTSRGRSIEGDIVRPPFVDRGKQK